jgi:hypothetical protein
MNIYKIRDQKLPHNEQCSNPYLHTIVFNGNKSPYGKCIHCGMLSENIYKEMFIYELKENIKLKRKRKQKSFNLTKKCVKIYQY